MRNMTIMLAVTAATLGSMPAAADEIIFRRPLPHRAYSRTQQNCTPGQPDCPAGDPFSPGEPTPGGDPGAGDYAYRWDVGPWRGMPPAAPRPR